MRLRNIKNKVRQIGLGMIVLGLALVPVASPLARAAGGGALLDDQFEFRAGQSVVIDVIANDQLAPSVDKLQITKLNDKAVNPGDVVLITGGKLTLNDDNTITWTPEVGFTGSPKFTYELQWYEITDIKSEDFEGVNPGLHVQPKTAVIHADNNIDWAIMAGTGVDGSQSFFGGYAPESNDKAQIAFPAVLPDKFDLTTMSSDEDVRTQGDFKIYSPACGDISIVRISGLCNEAYVGIADGDTMADNANDSKAIFLGIARNANVSDNAARLLVIDSSMENAAECVAAGGSYNASLTRCDWPQVTLPSELTPARGEYFNLSLAFRVKNGMLSATLLLNHKEVRDIELGAINLQGRSWLSAASSAFFVDDHGDNLTQKIRQVHTASATVQGKYLSENVPGVKEPLPKPPSTGIAPIGSWIVVPGGVLVATVSLIIVRKRSSQR